MQLTSDVKCYYCGHISGQVIVDRERSQRAMFRPRPGYTGDRPTSGRRLRCERCNGPVYLEEVTATEMPVMRRSRTRERQGLSGAA